MLKLKEYPEIRLNLYLNGEIVYKNISIPQSLDFRLQIAQQKLSGYYLKVDSPFWYLWDIEDKISEHVCNIFDTGEIDEWFPKYKLLDFGYINIDGERLYLCIELRKIQSNLC